MVKVKAPPQAVEQMDKTYRKGIDRLVSSTAMQHGDLDEKAMRLLDFLHAHGGRADEAVRHLEKSLHGRKRQDVANWHAYVYTLLRGFDEEAYREMKSGRRGKKNTGACEPQSPPSKTLSLNPRARQFVPGEPWVAEESAPAGATSAPAAPRQRKQRQQQQKKATPVAPEQTPEALEDTAKPELPNPSNSDIAEATLVDQKSRTLAGTVSELRSPALHAVGGAVALGLGGGAGGLAAGGAVGLACGLVAAPLTLGLSVPVGAVLGSSVGLCAGAATGSASGLLAGGLVGYWRVQRKAA